MIQKISYINEIQKLRLAYYREENNLKNINNMLIDLRRKRSKHKRDQKEIFELIMKKIEESENDNQPRTR